jgi:pimeloyl-ACP methyl ester carboxylesterase
VPVLAEDLQPYFAMDTSYDVIIGHSLGGTVALALLPLLPKEKETTVILVDPPLEIPEEKSKIDKVMILHSVTSVKTADEYMAENPAWSRVHCVLRTLAASMCDGTVVESIFAVNFQVVRIANVVNEFCLCDNQHNMPWSFSSLLKDIPPNVKVTVLVADPKFSDVCRLEHIPRDIERLNAIVVTGVGHCIQVERPDAIMDVIPRSRAEL